MARFNNPLDDVRIASPCNADWDQMIGNERTRFCGQCQLNVYNLSAMTRAEAELLIGTTEGRLCVRYFRRADGSILTSNCPVGLRAVRRRLSYVARAVSSAVLSFLAGVGIYGVANRPVMMGAIPVQSLELPVVQPMPVEMGEPVVMGTFAYEPPKPDVRMGKVYRGGRNNR